MSGLSAADISKLTTLISEVFMPRVMEMVKQEIEGRVRQEAFRLLNDVSGQELRDLVRKAVQQSVQVEVVMKS